MGKTSLRYVLKNFLDHFERLEACKKTNRDDDLYLTEFHSLKELTETLKSDDAYGCDQGLKDVNRRKNRYKDILPYDNSRVILSEYPGVPGSDYINANYVKGSTGSKCAYIASQGPLPNTLVDFWRMIWECEVTVIVMACNENESGKYKCESYWPPQNDQQSQYGNITVHLVKWKQVCPDFLVRTLRINAYNEERIVCQFHYTTWPDHGVPTTVEPIIELVRLMRDVQAGEARPILVHCSAGCGRTGTICSIDYVWSLLRTGKLTEDFSLYEIIKDMRRQRIAMVQTQEQYMLCYRAVAALFEQQLKMIDDHTYENLDEDGEPLMLREFSNENGNPESSDSSASDSEIAQCYNSHENSLKMSKYATMNSRQLTKTWKSSTFVDGNSDFPAGGYDRNSFSVESKQEKLVGKATVIRRPSIAKLKAMFENMNHNDQEPENRYFSTLKRSLSTRENCLLSNIQDFQNNSPGDRPRSIGESRHHQLINNDYSHNSTNTPSDCSSYSHIQRNSFDYQNERDLRDTPQSEKKFPENMINQGVKRPLHGIPVRQINVKPNERVNSIQMSQSVYGSSLRENRSSTSNPPPKPPRTYQHNLRNPNGPIYQMLPNSSHTGSIFVSVGLPRNKKEQRNERLHEGIYEPLILRNFNASAPNLALKNDGDDNVRRESMSFINDRKHNSALNNIKVMNNFQLNEGIYGSKNVPQKLVHIHQNQFQSIEPTYIKRDITSPPYLVNHAYNQKPIPHQMTNSQSNRIPNQNLTQRNLTLLGPYNTNRAPNRPPVRYVRPQPQANQVIDNEKLNQNLRSLEPQAAITETNSNNENITKVSVTSENPSKSSKKTKNREKKHKSLTALFGFGKKTKNKSSPPPVVSNQATHSNSQNQAQTIRPPHSHRFNPPTQWTQV